MTTDLDRIAVEPGKCGGKPCIRGMRITVLHVLELLATYPDRESLFAVPNEVGHLLMAGQPTPRSMTSGPSRARSLGGEKLVQLLELLARPTYTPRGHCIVEGFF